MNRPLQEFLDYLQYEKRYSPCTIIAYKTDCEFFLSFISDHDVLMDQVDNEIIYAFTALEIKMGHSRGTCRRRRCALKQFYRYLFNNGYIESNPFELLGIFKDEKKVPLYLDEEQVDDILEKNEERTDAVKVRDLAIVAMLYYTGMRVAEMTKLKLYDIRLDQHMVRVMGKGRKIRVIPFSESCAQYLRNYIDDFRPKLLNDDQILEDHIFLNQQGGPLTNAGVQYILKKMDIDLKLNLGLHPHAFRHTFATLMIDKGANMRILQELLGHSSINSTERYTHISIKLLKEAVNVFQPNKPKPRNR